MCPLLRLIDDEADGYHTACIEDTGDHWFTDAWSVNGSPTWLVFRGGEEKSRIDPAGKSAEEPYVNYAMRFSDVHPDIWYAEAIRWAAAEKIVSGFDAEYFAPDDPISREQLAAILYRYSEYTGKDRDISDSGGLDRFADAGDISNWALDAVGWAAANGLILGVSDDIFSPSSYAARGSHSLFSYVRLFLIVSLIF